MCEDIRSAIKDKLEEAVAKIEEATNHSTGLERAVEAAIDMSP